MNSAPEPEPPLVRCKWSKADLHSKPVFFRFLFNDGVANGTGKFFVLREENGQIALGIEASFKASVNYKLLPIQQRQADLIERVEPEGNPPDSFVLLE